MNRQSGNALFLILIAVALFAALSYAVTQAGRGGGNIDREQQMIDQAVSEQCNAAVDYAVNKLKVIGNCATSEISYELADGTNANSNAPADKSCHVFEPEGGDATACGAYLDPNCDLTALAIGEKCPVGDIVYAGEFSGTRLYTTAADQGIFTWNNGSSDWASTGAGSFTEGKANTDTLVGLTDSGAPYEAANACRSLGNAWYLPALDELDLLHTNKAAIGGFTTDGSFSQGHYWSSTERYSNSARRERFDNGFQYYAGSDKNASHSVRCVRR